MEKNSGFKYYSGIKYISYLDNTGYGIAGKMLLNALCTAGIELTWYPLVKTKHQYYPVETLFINSGYSQLDKLYRKDIEYDITIIHAVPFDYISIIDEEKRKGKKVFGHTVWETDQLPKDWIAILNRLDGIIVPTQWNKNIFESSGVFVPIVVLPHISQYEGNFSNRAEQFLSEIDKDTFVFYTISEWNERKIILKQIKTYIKTFSKKDNVCMVIKTSAINYTSFKRSWRTFFRKRHQPLMPTVKRILKKYKSSAKLIILTDPLTEGEIKQLHHRGNCFISLCRSEGWGMGAYEAAWYGKPVIMTAFGGQLDFLSPIYTYLVNYSLVNVIPNKGSAEYEANQKWAEPNQKHAEMLMKEVYENYKEASQRGLQLKAYVQQKYATSKITEAFISFFNKC